MSSLFKTRSASALRELKARRFQTCLRLLVVFLFLLPIVGAVRWVLCLLHLPEIGEWCWGSMFLFAGRGLQFDARVLGMFLLPFFGLLFFAAPHLWLFRRLLVWFHRAVRGFLLIAILLGLVDVLYVQEYRERFSFWLFNFFFDDPKAVWKTIYGTYPIGGYVLMIFLAYKCLSCLYSVLNGYLLRYEIPENNRWNFWLCPLTFLCLIILARGSLWHRPLQQIDVAITGNRFLNQSLPNSYYAVYFAAKEYGRQHCAKYIQKNLSGAQRDAAIAILSEGSHRSLSTLLEHKAQGCGLPKAPSHIFFVIMESQDNWPLLEKYAGLNLCPCLRALAQKGAYNARFVPSGMGTAAAIMTQICNFPAMDIWPNNISEGYRMSDFSVAAVWRQLGYLPRIFYGGYLSWQRLEAYAKTHGFLEIYGGDSMDSYKGNEWGIEDAGLFNFVQKKLLSGSERSFNLILTTSNHPPFNIDLEAAGAPLGHIRRWCSDEKRARQLAHAWYADRCVGDFVATLSRRFPEALFVITGDHSSRRYLTEKVSLYEETCVPLIFYGLAANDYLQSLAFSPGSHIDIMRTLIECVAPKGFVYRSFGKNLFAPNDFPEGYGAVTTITDSRMIHHDSSIEPIAGALPAHAPLLSSEAAQRIVARNKAWKTLAQWEFFHPSR